MAEEDDKNMFSLEVREVEVEGMERIKTLLMKTLCMAEMAFHQYIFRSVTHGSSHRQFKKVRVPITDLPVPFIEL